MAEQAKFLTGNLFRHVAVMSLTSSIGLMAIFAVDFIDMIFISMLGNSELAAAVGYAGAILFFTSSFGIGMAIAAGALVAQALGSGNDDEARVKASHALLYGFGFGAAFAAVVWMNLTPLVALMGATGETAKLAELYLAIIIPSLPVLILGMVGGAVLRAHGAARAAMMATIWGGLVNAVLDPILIFGLGLDLTGAALASVAARLTIAFMSLRPLIRDHGGLDRPEIKGLVADLRPVLAIAVPAILTQLATPVGQAFVTRSMAAFGEEAVAGMAIVGRLTPLSFAIVFALSGAVGPIIGQNHGAGDEQRVRRAFRDAILFVALCIAVITAALFALRGPIAALFEAEGVARQLVYLFCGPLALAFFFNGVIFVANASFNNLGHPYWSTWVNWGRHTLGTIPLVMLGAAIWGAPGVLIGQAAGGVLFGVLAWWMAARLMRSNAAPHQVEPYQRQARLHSLFHNRR